MYRLTRNSLLLVWAAAVLVMIGSVWWTHIPVQGYLADRAAPPAFRAAMPLRAQSALPADALRIVPYRLGEPPERTASGFYPVYDGSVPPELFSGRFPMLPAESIKGFGKTAYGVEYAGVKLLFLNAGRLGDPAQTEWLRRQANPDQTAIAVMDDLAPDSAFWSLMDEVGVQAVWTSDRVVMPAAALHSAAKPLEAETNGWLRWSPAERFREADSVLAEYDGRQLTFRAVGADGRELGRVAAEAAPGGGVRLQAGREPIPLVPGGSVWSWAAGGTGVFVTAPDGVDLSGERPMLSGGELPDKDWRSPGFDDSGWRRGAAPFGQQDGVKGPPLQTRLTGRGELPSVYFRKSFALGEDLQNIRTMRLDISYEDGFAAYLNGYEIARRGLPDGWLSPHSLAEPGEAVYRLEIDVTEQKAKLKPGANLLAIEVHRSHPNAERWLFDASLTVQK